MVNRGEVKYVFWDVDGTMYRKGVEYREGVGSIQTAHDFFRYLTHIMLKQGCQPAEVYSTLTSEYRGFIESKTLKQRVSEIPLEERQEWDFAVNQVGSNGGALKHLHHLEKTGNENLLHNMLAHIDFSGTLDRDPALLNIFQYLRTCGYVLAIITSEVYATVEVVAAALGFSISDFQVGADPMHPELFSVNDNMYYPIFCKNNSVSKPDCDAFLKAMRVLNISEPRECVYIGDRFANDVVPSITCGWQSVLITNDDDGIQTVSTDVGDAVSSYTKIGTLTDLKLIL